MCHNSFLLSGHGQKKLFDSYSLCTLVEGRRAAVSGCVSRTLSTSIQEEEEGAASCISKIRFICFYFNLLFQYAEFAISAKGFKTHSRLLYVMFFLLQLYFCGAEHRNMKHGAPQQLTAW